MCTKIILKTRKHSFSMCTIRFCSSGGADSLPPCEQTDRRKNITLPQTSFAGYKISTYLFWIPNDLESSTWK